VRDVADALVSASKIAKSGEIYIVGGTHITVKALIQTLDKIEPKRSTKMFLPIWLAYIVSSFTSLAQLFGRKSIFTPYAVYTLSRNYVYSHTKASKELGYAPRPIEVVERRTRVVQASFPFRIENGHEHGVKLTRSSSR
jgi:dihydroflavonol-4-reductase